MPLRWIILSAVCLGPLAGAAADLSAEQLAQARKLYVAKCAKCHDFYDPKAYPQAEWDEWMVKMKKKSRLNEEQFALATNYTALIRAGTVEAPAGRKSKKK